VGTVSTTSQLPPGSSPDTTIENESEATTTSAAAPGEPFIAGVDTIEQTTAASGGGIRPLLAWTPVEGAGAYVVMVYTEAGEPYWSAFTSESSVYVGGPLQIPAGRTGPNVAPGYTWSVYAEDSDGSLLAASPLREIAP
jgi:hypothetical protein